MVRDPAVYLGVGVEEHQLLTDPRAVALKLGTNSWTNARSVQTAGLGPTDIVETADLRAAGIDDREGPYVKYDSVEDSLRDGIHRVQKVGYAYERRFGANPSIGQVLSIWTQSSGERYTRSLVQNVTEWMAEDNDEPLTDDSRFAWMPDNTEFGYPKGARGRNGRPIELAIVHITAGVDSSGWLAGPNGSSTHYLSDRAFRPRLQMVREDDAAWTAGHREFNLRGLNFEFEILAGVPITDEMFANAADVMRPILQRLNIPLLYIGRDHGLGQRGIIGHSDVPDPNNPGRWGGAGNHTDPGEHWNWGRFIDLLNREQPTGPPVLPTAVPDPGVRTTPGGMTGGFRLPSSTRSFNSIGC